MKRTIKIALAVLLLALCAGMLEQDADVAEKCAYNETRPYRHGKKF